MTSLNQSVEVLRSDERGRVRVPVERREALLDEFEQSGLSAAKFARLVGVKYQTFANWTARRRKLRTESGAMDDNGAQGVGKVRLVEAYVGVALPTHGSSGLRIQLPGGARMEIGSPLQLRMAVELLKMLAPTVRG